MIRVLYNDGIMTRGPIAVQELPASEKLNSSLWRIINDRAMAMTARVSVTGMVAVWIYRVKDKEDPWYCDDIPACPYGELICFGLCSQLLDEVKMTWFLPGQVNDWNYRTMKVKPKEDCYHD